MYDARCIGNEFIRRANEQGRHLTHLQIQKLVYFAHARLLVLHRQPLIDQRFQVWEFGPVAPRLYHALKHHGNQPVLEAIPVGEPTVYSSREAAIFGWCFKRYGYLSGGQLIAITHASDTPWSRADARGQSFISDDDIADYHAQEWQRESLAELERIHRIPAFQRLVQESLERDECSDGYTLEELKQQIEQRAANSA